MQQHLLLGRLYVTSWVTYFGTAAVTAQRQTIMWFTLGRTLALLSLIICRHAVLAMLNKNKRPYDAEALPPGQRLRGNVADVFRNNLLSGSRTQEVFNDIARCGVGECKKLKGAQDSHASRNLTRKFLKLAQWPEKYWAKCRVINKKTHVVDEQWVAFLLPHECIAKLVKYGDLEVLLKTTRLDPNTLAHLQYCEGEAGCRLVPIGLWGDGVPVNWDRSESVDTLAMSLPGQDGEFKTLRLPIVGLSKKQVTEETWYDIMSVVLWSLQQCALGAYPTRRHNGTPWQDSDKGRAKLQGPMGFRGALGEVRGDWDFMAAVYRFPRHNLLVGCCWKCHATPNQVRGLSKEYPPKQEFVFIYLSHKSIIFLNRSLLLFIFSQQRISSQKNISS